MMIKCKLKRLPSSFKNNDVGAENSEQGDIYEVGCNSLSGSDFLGFFDTEMVINMVQRVHKYIICYIHEQ